MSIREMIQDIVRETLKGQGFRVAKVVSVQGDKTCTVELDSGTEVDGVRLQVDPASGLYYKPKVGSNVLLANIQDFDFAVIMYSAIDEIVYLDGSFGGLTKTPELKEQLDKTNEVLNAIKDTLTTWTPVSGDGGAALKAAAISALSGKQVGDYSNIENQKIKHGI